MSKVEDKDAPFCPECHERMVWDWELKMWVCPKHPEGAGGYGE